MQSKKRVGKSAGTGTLFSVLMMAAGSLAAVAAEAAPTQRLIIQPASSHAQPDGALPSFAALEAVHGVKLRSLRTLATGGVVFELQGRSLSAAELAALEAAVAALPGVDFAEQDRLLKPMFVPNDTHYGVQWHYHEATGGLNVEAAWDVTDGSGVTVAVLDTGYRPHADLAANLVGGYDMISDSFIGNDGNGRDSDALDPGDWVNAGECGGGQPTQNQNSSWHGTHVAGTIAAVTNNGTGVAGVAYGANLVGGYDMISDSFIGNDGNGRDSDALDPGDWVNAGECGGGQPTQNQNSSWHGTHVAGTIAAVTNNGTGVAGVAYGAKVVPVRVLGKCGGYTSDIADGIIWAAGGSVSGVPANSNPAEVLNLSLGGGGACGSTTQSAINTARSLGATVVVAAGNENQNASNSNPANCSGVVTVAATDRAGNRAYYSNYGSVVDVAAPGGETNVNAADGIASTLNSGTQGPGADSYVYFQGTSMATPHVAGVAALMYAVDPAISPDEVEADLKSSSRAFPGSCSQCGSGIVDATAAVAAASGGGGGGGGPGVLINGQTESNLSGASASETFFTLDVPAGQDDLNFTMAGGTGDADLYVKFGAAPTTGSYDCRPYLNGNNESCDFSNPQAGTWHVMIRGYSAYSGVSLTGTHSTSGGGGGGTCPAGYTEYTGSLSGTGANAYEPGGSYYYSASSGTHSGILTGPAGSDFDLYVQKWQGSSWSSKASSTSSSSNESIDYSGTSGYYRWRIYSYSGSGSYSFCLSNP